MGLSIRTTGHAKCNARTRSRNGRRTRPSASRSPGLNRRIVRIAGSDSSWLRTDFYYNASWQIVEEKVSATQTTFAAAAAASTTARYQYVWDLRYIDSPVLRDEDLDSDGDCTDDEGTGSERLSYANDANFNVTALVETDGTVAERTIYDAYGQPTIYDSTWSATIAESASKANELRFCGYVYDVVVGLYTVRYRVYDPALGSWVQRDPAGYVDGMSFYTYCKRSPVGSVDPTGTQQGKVPQGWKPNGWIDAPLADTVDEVKKDAKSAWYDLSTMSFGATSTVKSVEKSGMKTTVSLSLALSNDAKKFWVGTKNQVKVEVVDEKLRVFEVGDEIKFQSRNYTMQGYKKQVVQYPKQYKSIKKRRFSGCRTRVLIKFDDDIVTTRLVGYEKCPAGWTETKKTLEEEEKWKDIWSEQHNYYNVTYCHNTGWFRKKPGGLPNVGWNLQGKYRIAGIGEGANKRMLWAKAIAEWKSTSVGNLGEIQE